MNIKKALTLGLCAVMALSLVACGQKNDPKQPKNSDPETVITTPADIQKAIQDALGDGWLCDAEMEKDMVLNYYGLDGEQVEAIAAAENSNGSLNIDRVVVLQVKEGYAEDAIKALNGGFDQTASYSRMYNFDVQKMLGTRLYQNGNYIALITAGANGGELSEEEAAKLSNDEYAKIDAAWEDIFGSVPDNQIVIPEEDTNGNGGGLINDATNTPDPADTPKPTDAPKPANTPKPTNTPDPTDTPKPAATTPIDIIAAIQDALGDGWLCDAEMEKDMVLGYYGLDGEQVEVIAAAENSNGASIDRVVILQVKDGYAEDAVKALNGGFEQSASYSRMYNLSIPKMLGTRLYVSGNYVALITAGANSGELSEEEAAKLSNDEYAKIDAAWEDIFGSVPANQIVIPEEKEDTISPFEEEAGISGGGIMVGG
jgi:hypothetical protein